jgi:predicted transcriptional regulator
VAQQTRQLGDVGRDASRLVLGEPLKTYGQMLACASVRSQSKRSGVRLIIARQVYRWSGVMTDALITDQEIAILCDVLEGWGANLNADKKKVLDQLIAKGFVMPADQESLAKYKLTGKAQQLLAERGVGLGGG